MAPRLSEEGYAVAAAKAAAAGKEVGAWAGEVLEAATRAPLPPGDRDALAELIGLRGELRAVGNNLNQLVAILHSRPRLRPVAARGLLARAAGISEQIGRTVAAVHVAVARLGRRRV